MIFSKDKNSVDRLERKLLFRMLVFTVAAVSGYMILDLFLEIHEYSIITASSSIIIFSVLAWCTYKDFYVRIVKHITTIVLFCSVLGGFLSFDGFRGIFLFDYINLIFLVYFMFTGRDRFLYGVGLVLLMLMAFYINFYQPQLMHYLYEGKYEYHYLIYGIISRSIDAVIIAVSVKVVYEQERRNAMASNKELQAHIHKLNDLYTQMEVQSIEFREQNEYINELNMRLEERVNERTEKIKEKNRMLIEYAFLNAHKIRGPLARILGLIELTNIEQDIRKETLQDYFVLIKKSAIELDDVVNSVNQILEESDEDD